MLQDFPTQRILNLSEFQTFERDFLSHQIQSIGTQNQIFLFPNKDNKPTHLVYLYKESTEEINIPKNCAKPSKEKKKRIRKYTSNNPNNMKGHWTLQESLKYHYFLESNAEFFIDSERRKIDKIFKAMSIFIGTRQPHQCRSHHQKIEKKWQSFPKILLNLRLQNFKQTKRRYLLKEFQKMGMKESNFYQDEELKNEQQLYKKILEQGKCMLGSQQGQPADDNNPIQQMIPNCHKANCLCLMMSQRYQDQLIF